VSIQHIALTASFMALDLANWSVLAENQVGGVRRFPWSVRLMLTLSLENQTSVILKWISAVPVISHHKRISDGRLEGTAEWIFERKEYRKWKSSTVSTLLLLPGIRGSLYVSFFKGASPNQYMQLELARRILHPG